MMLKILFSVKCSAGTTRCCALEFLFVSVTIIVSNLQLLHLSLLRSGAFRVCCSVRFSFILLAKQKFHEPFNLLVQLLIRCTCFLASIRCIVLLFRGGVCVRLFNFMNHLIVTLAPSCDNFHFPNVQIKQIVYLVASRLHT